MKWTSRILIAIFLLLIGGLFASNIALKKEYDKVDKHDAYWTYGKVLEEHFKFLKLKGGNLTHIAFEQSPNCSVRILKDWQRNHDSPPIQSYVKDDTLFITFDYVPKEDWEKNWMKWITVVRIFAPELQIIEGVNTNFEMFKLKQNNISVNMSGRSKFEVESFIPDMNSIHVVQRDSAEVVFEMSPEYKKPTLAEGQPQNKIILNTLANQPPKSNEAMTIRSVDADLQGYSILDVGHAQIQDLKLAITDTSAIILSGQALRKFGKP
jgi:hypothetical protein